VPSTPLVKLIKRKTKAGSAIIRQYRVILTCLPEGEGAARNLILRVLTLGGLHLSEISARAAEGGEGIDLSATVTGEGVTEAGLEQAVQRIAAEPGLIRVRWLALEEG